MVVLAALLDIPKHILESGQGISRSKVVRLAGVDEHHRVLVALVRMHVSNDLVLTAVCALEVLEHGDHDGIL